MFSLWLSFERALGNLVVTTYPSTREVPWFGLKICEIQGSRQKLGALSLMGAVPSSSLLLHRENLK